MVRHCQILIPTVLFLICPVLAAEDDPAGLFNTLFGDQIKTVSATRDSADDIALATQMLDTLGSLNESPELQKLICERAYSLALGAPEGVDAAVTSMRQLSALDPAQNLDCQDRIVRALTMAHARTRGDERDVVAARLADALEKSADLRADGDEVTASVPLYRRAHAIAGRNDPQRADRLRDKIETATAKSQTMRRIEQYKLRVKQNPNDRKAGQELVMAYIVDLDDPDAAAKYSFLVEDELKQRLGLAKQPIDAIEPAACVDLAEWYHGLASNQIATTEAAMLQRAAGYYGRFIDSNPTDATTLTVARVKLTQINKRLAELDAGAPNVAQDGWVSLTPKPDQLVGWKVAGDKSAVNYKGGVVTMGRQVNLTFPVDTPNVAFRAKLTMPEGHALRIGVRGQAASQYQVIIRSRSVRLCRYVGNRAADIDSASVSLKAGEQYKFEIVAAGDKLIVRKDGEDIISATDGEFTEAGNIVLMTHGSDAGWKAQDMAYRPIPKAEVTRLKSK